MTKKRILVAGAGHIGSAIAHILATDPHFEIILADVHVHPHWNPRVQSVKLDFTDKAALDAYFSAHPCDAIVCCLPHFLTVLIAELALRHRMHYFDLSEDVKAGDFIAEHARTASEAFVPHCGLAPGLINIVAHDLISHFEEVFEAKLRCGALPQSSSNALQYARTWSTDGLINEYLNPCLQLVDGEITYCAGLDDVEDIQIDGNHYEAFNTSGGIGTLIDTHKHKVKTLNYKTIRYPGHRDKIHFLARGLYLDHDRTTLKRVLENALPVTEEDVIIVYVAVVGTREGTTSRRAFVRKYYPQSIGGHSFSAIQCTTASSASAVIDTVLSDETRFKGFVKQEDFTLLELHNNRFGKILA